MRGCSDCLSRVNLVMPFAGQCSRGAMGKALLALAGAVGFLLSGSGLPLCAADLDEARQHLIQGRHSSCIRSCEQAIGDQEYNEEWRLLLIQSLMAVGQ